MADSGNETRETDGAANRRLRDGDRDELVREEPLLLEIDGERLMTMRTPGADHDFVIGFLHSEGIVQKPAEIVTMDFAKGIPLDEPGPGPGGDGHVPDRVRVTLDAQSASLRREALKRTHEIRPSCGVCGIEDLATLVPEGHFAPNTPRVDAAGLHAMLRGLRSRQSLFARTGGCHGAALASADGAFLGFGEDVGRHNALDKAIGQAIRAGHATSGAIGLLSGRAGYELIAKLLRVGAPIIVSVSAASALAFDLCRDAGATLIGFARDGRHKVYWDEGRIE